MTKLPAPKKDKPAECRVVVEIIVRRDGHVRRSSIHQSSGFAPADAAAMPMLRKTTKLPVFTPGMNDAERMLRMPVVFPGKEPGTAGR